MPDLLTLELPLLGTPRVRYLTHINKEPGLYNLSLDMWVDEYYFNKIWTHCTPYVKWKCIKMKALPHQQLMLPLYVENVLL